MKFYKHHTGSIIVAEHNIEGYPPTFMSATPSEPTILCYFSVSGLEEVNFEDVKYLKYHLPKKVKIILSIQN